MNRKKTNVIQVGSQAIGGTFPVSVQSMCSTRTDDIDATLAQLEALEGAGCALARLAVPDARAAKALPDIRKNCRLPLVADIHFDYRLALAAVEAGFDKIRINPGNIGPPKRVKLLADACRANGVPIRIGVNSGSLEKDLLKRLGPTPEALCESAMRHVRLLEDLSFGDICVSIKSSGVADTVAACRLLSARTEHPLHLGVTEAGTPYMGVVKSAAGIGALLMDGIGDTLRVSLTADPVEEVKAGIAILKAVGLRKEGVNIIACPSCGRTDIDLFAAVHTLEELLRDVKAPITVAVMGCAVNGPGEARQADYGLAGGRGEGVLFRRGELVRKAPEAELVRALYELIMQDAGDLK
jgi:(E)-4-hydroxy-3-methylbut-2-enyl-diphosphate synthase